MPGKAQIQALLNIGFDTLHLPAENFLVTLYGIVFMYVLPRIGTHESCGIFNLQCKMFRSNRSYKEGHMV